MIRVHGDVRRINLPPMEPQGRALDGYDIMNDGQPQAVRGSPECDFSSRCRNLARFRVNAFNQEPRRVGGVRTIPSKV